ncbi:MAG: alpha-D-ribose 1-methylphosphonate 5-triphosphate diphosphatase [Pseudomonadota bacterium]
MWISNARIVLADAILPTGALRIEEGRIAELRDAPVQDAEIDGQGLLLMPGLIDMHGDMIEHALEPRVGVDVPLELAWRNLDRLLKVAGVTTAYASVSFHPRVADGQMRRYEQSKAAIQALQTLRPHLAVDHKVHARFELGFPRAYDIVSELVSAGMVELVSLMDHTKDQGLARDIERLTRSGEDAGKPHTETTDVLETMEKLVSACREAGVCLASHDDDTAEKVQMMNRFGVAICEFPETLEAAQAGRDTAQWTVMGAPNVLRGKSHSGNLSGRDAHAAGLLDMLAADYLPSAILPSVLILAKTDPDELPGALRKASLTPAQALGLEDRGEIALGKRADLILASDSGVGAVYATFVEGRLVYQDGSPGAKALGRIAA